MNLQKEEIEDIPESEKSLVDNVYSIDEIKLFINDLKNALKESIKPLVLVGHGIRLANATKEFLEFIEKYKVPVVCSLHGLDTIPYNHPSRIGFIGTYGNRWANYALGTCDLLIALGSRLDLRQTGSDIESFQKNKLIFHIDIDKAELNNRFNECKTLNVNVKNFFELVMKSENFKNDITKWYNEIEEKKQQIPDILELTNITGINPNIFIHQLSQNSKQANVFITDVGNNQMWAAQSIELSSEQRFLSSGGMGAMGYSLPAAIGASFALNKVPVVCIAGDGGFQINIQELQTIRRNNLPIKIVIINNHCLGMIRQFQDAYFDSCYQSTVNGYNTPDFEKVANAYEIDAFSISAPEEIEDGLKRLWEKPDQPFLLNVNLDIHTNVYPKMMFGSPITKMEPEN